MRSGGGARRNRRAFLVNFTAPWPTSGLSVFRPLSLARVSMHFSSAIVRSMPVAESVWMSKRGHSMPCSRLVAKTGRWKLECALKGTVEGRLRFISHLGGDLCYRVIG